MTLLVEGIAFLKDVSAPTITFVCSIPAVLFSIYVIWDDRRQARRSSANAGAAGHGAHGGHDAPKVSPPLSHGEPGAVAAKPSH